LSGNQQRREEFVDYHRTAEFVSTLNQDVPVRRKNGATKNIASLFDAKISVLT